jgi:hypothetical protein
MSLATVGKQFVEMCNQGKNFDVMRLMYAPGIVSAEAGGTETVGKEQVIKKSERWAATLTINGEKVRGPFFSLPNPTATDTGQFAVHYTFDVTPKSTGVRQSQEEVALYTVENGQITREQFFYEGTW